MRILEQRIALLAIWVFGLQIYGLPVYSTVVDYSNILLVVLVSLCMLDNTLSINKNIQKFILLMIIVEYILYITNRVPFYRFLSSATWISSFILIYAYGEKLNIKTNKVFNALFWVAQITGGLVLIQYFILSDERPSGFFGEPSTAGLIFLATSTAFIFKTKYAATKHIKIKSVVYAIYFFGLSNISTSAHLLTFLLSSLIFFLVYDKGLFSIKNIVILILFISIGGLAVLNSEHLLSRLDMDTESNLSQLAWLGGYDQMIGSLKLNPIFGQGLGGTGLFNFDSDALYELADKGASNLGLLDAYSGFFRLVIEMGALPVLIIFSAMANKLLKFRTYINSYNKKYIDDNIVFILVFTQTVLIGVLLKESVWSRSTTAICALLFCTIRFRAINLKNIS